MTNEELREHWGETEPLPTVPRTPAVRALGIGLALLVALTLVLLVLVPGMAAQTRQKDLREIHQCEMAHVLGGKSLGTAELLCARNW